MHVCYKRFNEALVFNHLLLNVQLPVALFITLIMQQKAQMASNFQKCSVAPGGFKHMTSDFLQGLTPERKGRISPHKSPQSCFHLGLQKQIFPHLSPCVCSEIPAALPPSPFFTFLHFISRCRLVQTVFVLVSRPESPVDQTAIVFPPIPGRVKVLSCVRWAACHHLSLN